jgi:hypothetical protein
MHLSRLLSTVAMAFLAIACNSQAQQPGAALHEVEDLGLMVQPLNLSVEDIEEDADLLDQAGEEVGAIESVLADGSGQPAAITAEVGSFAGADEKTVVIALDRLQVDDDGDLVVQMSREELQRLPAWDD